MANDVKVYRPLSGGQSLQTDAGDTVNTNPVQITNQIDDGAGMITTQTTNLIETSIENNAAGTGDVVTATLNNIGEITDNDGTTVIEFNPTAAEVMNLTNVAGDFNLNGGIDATNVQTINNNNGDPVIALVEPEEESVFVGASNRLNILNDTANGPVPLDAIGRINYNVVAVNESTYDALVSGGTVDANTLYLIREDI